MLNEASGVCCCHGWKVAGQPCCWQESYGCGRLLSCGIVQGDLDTPFGKALAPAGSLEGPDTPDSVDSMVRCLFWVTHALPPPALLARQ